MTTERIVIIGGGQAGIQLADSLREEGSQAQIDVFSSESELPYQRPPLSKDFLSLDGEASALPLRAERFFNERKIAFHPGVSVTNIDSATHTVTTDEGERFHYSQLVLATGARNRIITLPGGELQGVHYLRTLEDAQKLREKLLTAANVLVIGGGFIGLEFAASARLRGINVSVLEMGSRVMARVLTPAMSEYFYRAHIEIGIRTYLQEGIVELQGTDGRVSSGVGTSGKIYPADLVVVGIGVIPNTQLAEQAGLDVANGIVVDQFLRTRDPHIWAIGDCSEYPDSRTEAMIRLESVQNAVDQAKTLAKTLTGNPTAYTSPPWFWSHQGAQRLQIAGRIDQNVDTVLRGHPDDGAFSVFCFQEGQFIGAESVNQSKVHLAARRILARGIQLTPEQAADSSFDLKAHSKQGVTV